MTLTSTKDICTALYNSKYVYHNEKELQHGVGIVLSGMGLGFKPEFPLTPRDRIDFLVGELGIECKADDSSGGTSLAAVTRQLMRYSQSAKVKELILLTTMSKHRNLPDSLNGKPLYIVHLLRSFL